MPTNILLLSAVLLAANVFDVSLAEKDKIKTAHIVRIVEKVDTTEADDANTNPLTRMNTIYREEIWFDATKNAAKAEQALLENPAECSIELIRDDYTISTLMRKPNGIDRPDIFVQERTPPRREIFDSPFLGIINKDLTTGRVFIDQETINGLEHVTFDLPPEAPFHQKVVAVCDPSKKYRCREINFYNGATLKAKITAGNYTDCNGVLYPSQYSYRIYEDGRVVTEENMFTESAQFNIDIKKEAIEATAKADGEIQNFDTGKITKIKAGQRFTTKP